jgi:hypothetical protein
MNGRRASMTGCHQDPVEKTLRMDLLHHLSVDPIPRAEEPVAIDPVNGGRQDRGDPCNELSIVALERMTRTHDGNRAPCAATALETLARPSELPELLRFPAGK